MATADASSDGLGNVTLTFEPRLRFSPLDNAAIFVEDGVLSKPQGVFILTNQEQVWSSLPAATPQSRRSAVGLELREDVFATQP